jgi:hypothetical protein
MLAIPSDNRTQIGVAIFPNLHAFEFSRNVAATFSSDNSGVINETKDIQLQPSVAVRLSRITSSFFAQPC